MQLFAADIVSLAVAKLGQWWVFFSYKMLAHSLMQQIMVKWVSTTLYDTVPGGESLRNTYK